MAKQHTLPVLTENKLVHGWASAPKVRIRQATTADLDIVSKLVALAEVTVEEPVRDAVVDGVVGAGLRVGLRSGPDAYLHYMATRFAAHQKTSPMQAYLEAALALVAEHRSDGVVGALIAYPPISVVEDVLAYAISAGASRDAQLKTMLTAGMHLARVKALAVAESARGANIGGSLLKWCRQVYFHCRYQTIYGTMPPTPGLDGFYRRAGFEVREVDEPLDLSLMFNVPMVLGPGPGERIFHCDRPRS